MESDPKRKSEAITTDITDAMSKEKKQRLEEETRTLSILMATHLGSAASARSNESDELELPGVWKPSVS